VDGGVPKLPWVAGIALALTCAGTARAHDPARGIGLTWASSATDALPLIVANRGLVFADRDNGSVRFSLRCAEGFGASVADVPGVFFDGPDSLVVSVYSGTLRTSDRACTLASGTGLSGSSFGAVVQDAAISSRLYVTSRTIQTTAALFVSEDLGRTWAARFTNPANEYYDALLVAPSDAQRLYASGRRLDRDQKKLLFLSSVSLDAGKTWQDTSFDSKLTPFAVHPQHADVVFAYEAMDTLETVFRVLRSDDRGVSYASVLEGVPQPVAFATSGPGAPSWLGLSTQGGHGGLYRSEDDGMHFERAHADTVQRATCLIERQGRLWLCANMAPNENGVWFSDDEGNSFQKFMSFADVTAPVPCDGEPQALCARAWLDFDRELHPPDDVDTVARDAGTPDAGGPPPQQPPSSLPQPAGCQLGSSPAPPLRTWCGSVAVVMAALRLRRRRKCSEAAAPVKLPCSSTRTNTAI
jgi:hypothetical protein